MSAPKVDVLAVIDREIVTRDDAAIACKAAGERLDAIVHAEERDELKAARTAVAELIERDKAAAQVFDCILRGVNDLSGPMGYRSEQFVAGWLESWAKSLNAAGFKPSNPEATDIARALARIGGAA